MIADSVGTITTFDLRNYYDTDTLVSDLSDFDVVWVGGGNLFYLRWLCRESGFDNAIAILAKKGVVYGGDSAGAVIAGPTIDGFQPADEPEDAPELVLSGFNLTGTTVIPHYDHPKYAPLMAGIEKDLKARSVKTVRLNDDQALIINGDSQVVN